MDGVLEDECIGSSAAEVIDGAIGSTGFKFQLRSAGDINGLRESEGDVNDVTSVIAAIGGGAGDGLDGGSGFIGDIGDVAVDHFFSGVTSGVGGDDGEGIGCLLYTSDASGLSDSACGGVDGKAGDIASCGLEGVGDSACDGGVCVAGLSGVDDGADAVFGNSEASGTRDEGWCYFINVGDGEGDVLRGGVPSGIGGNDGEEIGVLGFVVGVSGECDSAGCGVNREETAVSGIGEAVGDADITVSIGVIDDLCSTTVFGDRDGDAGRCREEGSRGVDDDGLATGEGGRVIGGGEGESGVVASGVFDGAAVERQGSGIEVLEIG